MIHYHGADINPAAAMLQLAGKHFCVSYAWPNRCELAHQIGQSVLLDNGAWSLFNKGEPVDWRAFIEWSERWLEYPTTWAIVPDVIGGTGEENDELLAWFLREAGGHLRREQLAPVWHVNQPVERLQRLCSEHWKVCIGSGAHKPGSTEWRHIMDKAFNALCGGSGPVPNWLHLLRGTSLAGSEYPLASVDSATLARSFKGDNKKAQPFDLAKRATEVDARQCPSRWGERDQLSMLEEIELPTEPYRTSKPRVGPKLFNDEEELA